MQATVTRFSHTSSRYAAQATDLPVPYQTAWVGFKTSPNETNTTPLPSKNSHIFPSSCYDIPNNG
jgi:hypothetical protein